MTPEPSPNSPALRDQLITIPLMLVGMFFFLRLSMFGRHFNGSLTWWAWVFRILAWACAIVGAATIVALVERFFKKK